MGITQIWCLFLLLTTGGHGRNVTFLLGTDEGVILLNTAFVDSFHTIPTTHEVFGVDYHLERNMAYYRSGDTLYRSTLIPTSDPVSVETSIVSKMSLYSGFAVNWVHDVIYWVDTGLNCLMMMDLDGKHVTIININMDYPMNRPFTVKRVEVDPEVGKLFWLVHYTLQWCDLTGDNYSNNLSRRGVSVTSFSLDIPASRLFYVGTTYSVDFNLYEVHYSADGTSSLINRQTTPQLGDVYNLVILGNYLYWVNYDDWQVIYSQTLNMTGEPEKIHTKHRSMLYMRVVDRHLQKTYRGDPCQHTPCSHFCVHQRGVARCLCPDGMVLVTNSTCLGTPFGVNMFNIAAGYSFMIAATTELVYNLDYHLECNLVYFYAEQKLFRTTLDPNNSSSYTVVKEVGICRGFALDWVHNVIYWMDCSNNSTSLKLMDLEGNNETTVMKRPGQAFVRRMAVDPHVGKVFWIAGEKLEMSYLTGENFQTNLSNSSVRTFTLDISSRRLFYTSDYWGTTHIHEMSYSSDGMVDTSTPTSLRLTVVGSVAVLGDYLYYSYYDVIYRKLTTMNEPPKLIKTLKLILDMRVVDPELQKPFIGECQQTTCSHFCVHQRGVARCLCPDGMFLGNKMICSVKITGTKFVLHLLGYSLQLVVLIVLLAATFSFMLHANGRYFEWPYWMT